MLIGNKKSCIFEIVVPKLDGFVFLLALTYFFVGRMKVHWYKVFYRGVSTHSFVVKTQFEHSNSDPFNRDPFPHSPAWDNATLPGLLLSRVAIERSENQTL